MANKVLCFCTRQVSWEGMGVPASWRRERGADHGKRSLAGAFAVGVMLLTHPERLQHHDDLWISCAGDEYYAPHTFGGFSRAPIFGFGGGKVEFDACWCGYANGDCGSASAFVSQ
jgi:hypothetical protein